MHHVSLDLSTRYINLAIPSMKALGLDTNPHHRSEEYRPRYAPFLFLNYDPTNNVDGPLQ